MKKLLTITSIASTVAVLALLAACQTTGTGSVVAQKESLLSQSGFKVITVTDEEQKQAVSELAQGKVSAVKYKGKLYYVFPTATKDRIYVGRQKQYNVYKQALLAQQGQQQMAGTPTSTYETAGPHDISVQQFRGFGPMGASAWDR